MNVRRLIAGATTIFACIQLQPGAVAGIGPYSAAFAPAGPAGDFIPFDFFGGNRIFLKGTINGHPADIMLDSGAERTTVDQELVGSLRLKSTADVQITGEAGAQPGHLYGGVDVSAGGIRLGNLVVHGTDLQPVSRYLGRPLTVVLGAEAFQSALVDLDFHNRQLAFHDPENFKIPEGFVRVPMMTDPIDGAPSITVSIEDRAPTAAVFDLGSAAPVAISAALEAKEHFLDARPASDVPMGGVGGLSTHDVATLHTIKVGDTVIHDVPAYFNRSLGEVPTSGALLGMDIFSRFRVITDYRHRAIWFRPDEAAVSQPFPKERSGLRSTFSGNRLQVVFISKGSPAAAGAWKVGDVIVAIDGQKVGADFPASPLSQWRNGPAGRTVVLTLADGSRRSLTLADYY